MSLSASALAIESWTLYVLGVCLIASRIIFRSMTLGSISNLQCDDWLMILVLIPFTGTIVSANQVLIHWNTEWGLKFRFALEEFHITTTWLVKGCLFILYRRIFPSATSRNQRVFLAWIAAYTVVTYAAIQILLPLWCNPASEYFNPKSTNPQCTTYRNHTITTLILALTTDMAALIYPIAFIPTPRKLLLALLFLLGLFITATTIISRFYILVHPTSRTYLPWYVAETAGTIYFTNLPFLSSLLSSTTPVERIRHLSSNLSLSQWPGSRSSSMKNSTSDRFQRLSSVATITSSIAPPEVEIEQIWSDSGIPPSTPAKQIHTLKPTDAPPELTGYWSNRSSTKDVDVEMLAPVMR